MNITRRKKRTANVGIFGVGRLLHQFTAQHLQLLRVTGIEDRQFAAVVGLQIDGELSEPLQFGRLLSLEVGRRRLRACQSQ